MCICPILVGVLGIVCAYRPIRTYLRKHRPETPNNVGRDPRAYKPAKTYELLENGEWKTITHHFHGGTLG